MSGTGNVVMLTNVVNAFHGGLFVILQEQLKHYVDVATV